MFNEVVFEDILIANPRAGEASKVKPLTPRERYELDSDAINNPFVEFGPCQCYECEAYRIALSQKGD